MHQRCSLEFLGSGFDLAIPALRGVFVGGGRLTSHPCIEV